MHLRCDAHVASYRLFTPRRTLPGLHGLLQLLITLHLHGSFGFVEQHYRWFVVVTHARSDFGLHARRTVACARAHTRLRSPFGFAHCYILIPQYVTLIPVTLLVYAYVFTLAATPRAVAIYYTAHLRTRLRVRHAVTTLRLLRLRWSLFPLLPGVCSPLIWLHHCAFTTRFARIAFAMPYVYLCCRISALPRDTLRFDYAVCAFCRGFWSARSHAFCFYLYYAYGRCQFTFSFYALQYGLFPRFTRCYVYSVDFSVFAVVGILPAVD